MKNFDNISRTVLKFHTQLSDDNNHRYKSWEHCYGYFKRKTVDLDTACLQLAFYLASSGMYRGSSFLLWKDYRIHKNVVRHLLKHRHLQSIDFLEITEDQVNEISELMIWIQDWYENSIHCINGEKREVHATDTLTTKIVLGTLGCVPAFDRYFIDGFRDCGLKYSAMREENFSSVVHFYQRNESNFLQANKKIQARTGSRYPPMKLVDMYFWQIGSQLDQK